MKTSGKPDDLLLLFESSEHRRSPTQAKRKAEIAGRKNYFFDLPGLAWGRAWSGLVLSPPGSLLLETTPWTKRFFKDCPEEEQNNTHQRTRRPSAK